MILYHGSYLEVSKPDLEHSRLNVDFGKGFYTTPILEQAENWCKKIRSEGKEGIVSVYEFSEEAFESLKTLKFDSYSEEWLDFVVNCRLSKDKSDYDIVIGGVANDKVFNTIELFFDGLIEKKEAINRLRYEQPNLQICFRSEESLKYLHFERSNKIC
jgi:hypothetical protein